jgi:hypothetical protein
MSKNKPGILYEGPSQIDGKPVVVIATVGSKNSKTGNMVQTWILRSDLHPHEAWKTGEDASICGDCTHRGVMTEDGMAKRTCYVTWFGPMAVWKAYKAGSYSRLSPGEIRALTKGELIRLGSYGDPAAVPFELWEDITRYSKGHTGYTHQWRNCDKRFARLCMASADTIEDRKAAQALGYRVFGIGDKKSKDEVVCPATTPAKLSCAECMACGGLASKAKANITIPLHGSTSVISAARLRWGEGLQPT